MSLKQWYDNGWLKEHATSREEIGNLLAIVDRDLADARGNISADWKFGIAYNAALKLCTILLYASGYRPAHGMHHFRVLNALPLILGVKRKTDALYLDTCRKKRNTVEYDAAGGATEDNAAELLRFTSALKQDVMQWLAEKHPDLAG